jgi:hypothetical protein
MHRFRAVTEPMMAQFQLIMFMKNLGHAPYGRAGG